MNVEQAPRVYLAGPGVFRPDAVSFGEALKAKCAAAGLFGLFPFDNEISSASPRETARLIYEANKELLDSAQAVIADLSPFRGPNMDPGTAWEIGYAIAKQIPVFAWSDDSSALFDRTKRHSPGSRSDLDAAGWTIENFGLNENLMLVMSTNLSDDVDAAISQCARALKQN